VTVDRWLDESLRRELAAARSTIVQTAASAFGAGAQVEALPPATVVVDFSIGKRQALQIASKLRSIHGLSSIKLIAVLASVDQRSVDLSDFDDVLHRPLDPRLLAKRIQTLIGR
jgi:DNA-binding response OmpR family regulator